MRELIKDGIVCVVAVVAAHFCEGCSGQLDQVAEQIPVALDCKQSDGKQAAALIELAVGDQKAFAESLVKRGKEDPAGLACDLLSARETMLRNGQRVTDAYKLLSDTLDDLGVR